MSETAQMGLQEMFEGMNNGIQTQNNNVQKIDLGPTYYVTLGENGSEGEWFYYDFITGKAKKAKADSLTTCTQIIGVLTADGVTDEARFFRYQGWHQKTAWGLTADSLYYLSAATAGAQTLTPPATPNLVIPLGHTRADTDKFYIMRENADVVAMVDPMTTRGDVIFRNASNATARLPVGAAGEALLSDGTDVVWGIAGGGGLPNALVPTDYPDVASAIAGEASGALIGIEDHIAVDAGADLVPKYGQRFVNWGTAGIGGVGTIILMEDYIVNNTSDDVGFFGITFKHNSSTVEFKYINSGDRFTMRDCYFDVPAGGNIKVINNSGDKCRFKGLWIDDAFNSFQTVYQNTGDDCSIEDCNFKGVRGNSNTPFILGNIQNHLMKDIYLEYGSQQVNTIGTITQASSLAEYGNRFENITIVGNGTANANNGISTNHVRDVWKNIRLKGLNIGAQILSEAHMDALEIDSCQTALWLRNENAQLSNVTIIDSAIQDIKTGADPHYTHIMNLTVLGSSANGSVFEHDKVSIENAYFENDVTITDGDKNSFANCYLGGDVIITGTSENNIFNGCQIEGSWLDSSTNQKNDWMAPREQAIVDLDGFGKYTDPQIACDKEGEDAAIFFRKGTYALTQAIITKKGQSLLVVNRGEVKFDCTAARTTITASTLSWANADNSVNDSGSGLGNFAVGMVIRGSGTAGNNLLFRIVTATAAKLTLADNTVTDEVVGASMSLDEKIILYVGSRDDAVETAGSVSVTKDSTAMVGAGTVMTNKVSGNYIVIRAVAYELDVITDDLNWTVKKRYKGPTKSGLDYRALALDKNITIDGIDIEGYETKAGDTNDGLIDIFGVVDFQLKNASASCVQSTNRVMEVNDLYNSWMDNFSVEGDLSYYGVSVNYSDGNSFQGFQIKGVRRGFQFFECHWNAVNNSFALGCSDYGFSIRNDSKFNTFTGCHAIGCDATGFTANSDHNTFNGCFSQYNNGAGFLLTESWCVVNGCNSSYNVEHGIENTNGDNQVTNCTIYGNDSGDTDTYSGIYITAGGAHAHLVGNRISDNDHYQIDNAGLSTYLEGNMTEGTLQTGEINNTGTMYGSNYDWTNGYMVQYGDVSFLGDVDVKTSASIAYIRSTVYDSGFANPQIHLRKSDSTTIGTIAQTNSGDGLGQWWFMGVDASPAFNRGAVIKANQNGVANTRVPTDLIFETYTAVGVNANQFILRSAGPIEFGGALNVNGNFIDNVSYLLGDATFLRIGAAGASGHGLTADQDLLIAGKLEVDGTAFFDADMQIHGSPGHLFWMESGGGAANLNAHYGYDQFVLGLDVEIGKQFILTSYINRILDHDHPLQTNPTSFIHSNLSPNVSNNEWGSTHHDGGDFVFTTGIEIGVGSAPTTIPNEFVFAPRGVQGVKITALKGIAIKITNETGAVTVKGQIVKPDTANNDAAILTAADDLEVTGVWLDSGVADGAEAWMVVVGIADVAMEDNTAATRGNWVRTSITEAGYADATNAGAPAPINQTHFAEIGHCIETVAAGGGGTHILARCVLHFN